MSGRGVTKKLYGTYSHVHIRIGVFNRRGGSGEISKMLQEEGHFLIGGGSDQPKMFKRGVLNRRGGSEALHLFIREGPNKWTNKCIFSRAN